MWSAHFTPVAGHIRVYDVADGYKNRIPYSGILTVEFLTDEIIYICGAHGTTVNRRIFKICVNTLMDMGVKKMLYERRGVLKERVLVYSNIE